jgi:ParB-like chromosome segregation protein Spo0J
MANKKTTPLLWTNGKARIGDLVNYEKNPVQLSDKQAKELAKSLQKFGHIIPYTAAAPKNGSKIPILDGHQRKRVEMELLGVKPDTMVEIRFPDRKLTEKERQEAIVRLRKNVGEWDFDILANNFDIPDLIDWGFSEKELIGSGFSIPEFKEYDETIADGIGVCKCSTCGHEHAKKD